jgi:nucleoside phosphorylase
MRAKAGASRRILIVAAWAPELASLGRISPGPNHTLVRSTVGVGLIEAAASTARLIATLNPSAIVLVGTAGIYPGARIAPNIGSAVIAESFHLASASVATAAAYLPAPLPATATAAPRLTQAIARATHLPTAVVACPLGISRTRAIARRLQTATTADVENLEAFAVARAAAAARVPFAAILGISNVVGPDSHAEWRAHADEAARAACAALRTTLVQLGAISDSGRPRGRGPSGH